MGEYLDIKIKKEREKNESKFRFASSKNKFAPYKTEDWIKCELYKILTNLGYECYPEMLFRSSVDFKYHSGKLRKLSVKADLAVYKNNSLCCVVEIKNRGERVIGPKEKGSQYRRYSMLGIDFIYCMGEHQIFETAERINECYG